MRPEHRAVLAILVFIGGALLLKIVLRQSTVAATDTIAQRVRTLGGDNLCDAVYLDLAQAAERAGEENTGPEEATVVFTWEAVGVIGNGGFQYLYEGALHDRDPGFVRTMAAIRAVGAEDMHRAFVESLAKFPDSRPPADQAARLKIYKAVPDAEQMRINVIFWNGKPPFFSGLANYIREHATALDAALAGHRSRRR